MTATATAPVAGERAILATIANALGRKTLRGVSAADAKSAIRALAEDRNDWENAWNGLIWGINTGRISTESYTKWRGMSGRDVAVAFAGVVVAGDATPGTAWEIWRALLA